MRGFPLIGSKSAAAPTQREEIKLRILIPLAVALCLLLGAFFWRTYWEGRQRNHAELEHNIAETEAVFSGYLEKDSQMMDAALSLIADDEQLKAAFENGDRQALLKRAEPIFKQFLGDHRVTHFYFSDVDRVNFLRVHQPDRHGDTIDRFTTRQAERTRRTAWGIELGPLGTFTLRVVKPWCDGERLIGYIELGEEIDHVMDGVRETVQVAVYPVIRKEFLDRQRWESGMDMLGHPGNWDQFSEVVLLGQTPILQGFPEIIIRRQNGDTSSDYHLDGKDAFSRVGFLPLVDAGGRTVGELAICTDVTAQQTAWSRSILAAAVLCIVIGGVLFAFFFVFLGRIERDLALARHKAAEESRLREEAQAKHAEEIRDRYDQLQTVVDGIPHSLMLVDRDFKIALANRAVRNMVGGINPAKHGLTCHVVSHNSTTPCDGPNEPCPLKMVISQRKPVKVSHVHIDSDGEKHTMDITATPIFGEDGEVRQVIECGHDVTDRVRAMEAIRLQSSALEAAANAIVIADRQGRITWANPAFTQLTGFSLEEVLGRGLSILGSNKQSEEFYAQLWKTISEGQMWRGEIVNRRRDGTLFTVDTTITPVLNEGGEIEHFVAIQQDITSRKRTESELREAKLAAEAANRAKSDFLANMSHEIRTPMTAVIGFAETLLDSNQTEAERHDAVWTIRRSGEHLLSVINDILDLSKVEVGEMTLESRACSPRELLAETESFIRGRAADKGLEFSIECTGTLPENIETDPTRLRQILINLIGNAIKFTDSGSVRMVARFLDEEHPVLLFDVIDTGIGMTPQQTTKIFQPFVQADGSTTRKFGGTGLGLTLSKQLAELLGGDIVLKDTQVGVGTRFQVTIPVRPVKIEETSPDAEMATPPKTAPAEQAEAGCGPLACRVLLAEDGIDNQRIIAIFLKAMGAEVVVVENGQLAVDEALEAQTQDRPFDILLMDMQMPVMDGYEATALLRESEYSLPIIALTARTMADDRQKCLNAGCDDYLSKPIDRTTLEQTLRRHVATLTPRQVS